MRGPRPSREPRKRSLAALTFDRVTNAVFAAVLMLTTAVVMFYGPEDACLHIAAVIASSGPILGMPDAPGWEGVTAD